MPASRPPQLALAHSIPLPPLREDLRLHEAAPNHDGSPAWVIQDPVNNRFYRIGILEFELLSRWHFANADELLAAARGETLLQPTLDELNELVDFLRINHLLAIRGARLTEQLIDAHRRQVGSRLRWLLHNYLFFRVPLWNPDRALQALTRYLGFLLSPASLWILAAATATGIVLVARQWDSFSASFVDTLTPGGLASYLIALAIAKSLHELGHALTATRYGVRVAHMGVAFLVMWPVLYTDTGESWRLKDRRQRLAIASAGIATEMALAGLATLGWALVPPGDLRQALFFLATTAWTLSLAINLSPFMRFDGYFILSDLLDLPNLHQRASDLARWWLRGRLLGWRDPAPEQFGADRRRLLIGFALATWIYRLSVFIAIAVAVYLFFFKLLGILLFLVEIAWFVVRPVLEEFKVWQKRQAEIARSRKLAAIALGFGLLALAMIPWNLSVMAEGWAHANPGLALHSPLPARLVSLPAPGAAVTQFSTVYVLESPESRYRAAVASAGADAIQMQLAGLAAIPDGEQRRASLEQMRAVKQAEADAQSGEMQRLSLTAPFDGEVFDIDPGLQPGVWVSPNHTLGYIAKRGQWQAEAFVTESDLARIRPGNDVLFYPDDNPLLPRHGRVTDVERSRLTTLPHDLLATRHGGRIPVLQDSAGLTPREALFRVRIALTDGMDRMAVRRGQILIRGESRSWLAGAVMHALAVLVREASF